MIAMTSHMNGWSAQNTSVDDEDAIIVIKQFAGDDICRDEAIDEIEFEFQSDEENFDSSLSNSPTSCTASTRSQLDSNDWDLCPAMHGFDNMKTCAQSDEMNAAVGGGSPSESEVMVHKSSFISSHGPSSVPYYHHIVPSYVAIPSPITDTNGSPPCFSSRSSSSPSPQTPLTDFTYEPRSHNRAATMQSPPPPFSEAAYSSSSSYQQHSTMIFRGSYQCTSLVSCDNRWAPLPSPDQAFPVQLYQLEPSRVVADGDDIAAYSCDIVTQRNGLQFYKDTTPVSGTLTDGCQKLAKRTAEHEAAQEKAKRFIKSRPRKTKPPVQVDIAGIKDIASSSQLWEFTLKVLEKPTYSYMVSWENRNEGIFRFHNAQAFATLWGRHRNRPNMTYDKVARALRYYYKRDILNQVGGRLTYKFSKRLQKMFSTQD